MALPLGPRVSSPCTRAMPPLPPSVPPTHACSMRCRYPHASHARRPTCTPTSPRSGPHLVSCPPLPSGAGARPAQPSRPPAAHRPPAHRVHLHRAAEGAAAWHHGGGSLGAGGGLLREGTPGPSWSCCSRCSCSPTAVPRGSRRRPGPSSVGSARRRPSPSRPRSSPLPPPPWRALSHSGRSACCATPACRPSQYCNDNRYQNPGFDLPWLGGIGIEYQV